MHNQVNSSLGPCDTGSFNGMWPTVASSVVHVYSPQALRMTPVGRVKKSQTLWGVGVRDLLGY